MSSEANTDDQSMEEILQSIKRIIAEEGDEPAASSASYSGSDVLELTEMVKDDGTVVELESKPASAIEKMPDEPIILSDSAVMPMIDKAPQAAFVATPTGTLVSEQTAAATTASLKTLAAKTRPAEAPLPSIDSPSFRSGHTVEDLVMEALRPALKSWLDANLPTLVERLVEKEIKKIANN